MRVGLLVLQDSIIDTIEYQGQQADDAEHDSVLRDQGTDAHRPKLPQCYWCKEGPG